VWASGVGVRRPLWDDLGVVPGRGGESPSYDELAAVVVGLTARLDELSARVGDLESDSTRLVAENTALREENALLRAENGELRRRLGLNSTNSSKPPSFPWPSAAELYRCRWQRHSSASGASGSANGDPQLAGEVCPTA
jgi:hypothetical protein